MRFWKANGQGAVGVTTSFQDAEPKYRATLVGAQGIVVSTIRIAASDDVEARKKAKALVDGHAVDLWEGLRFIDHFPAMDEAQDP